jgi:hypothetical protein
MATYVYSENEREALLNVGSSDAVDVWLGDQRVLHELRCISGNTGGDYGQEFTIYVDEFKVPVTLQAGWNRVMVRTAQRNNCPRAFQVSLRVSDADGDAIEGLIVDPLRGEGGKPEPSARPTRPLPDLSGIIESTPVAQTPTPTATATPSTPVSSTAPSQSPPGGLTATRVPMFVLIGSDDNNRAGGVEFLTQALTGRVNPPGSGASATFDGQPAHMSFYLIGSDIYENGEVQLRDQYMTAYETGHELGNHGFFATQQEAARGTIARWTDNWLRPTQEAIEQMFVEYGYTVEDARAAVNGFRSPENVIDATLYEALSLMGYEYGNSSNTNHSTNRPAWWPGTLEAGWPGGATWDTRDFGTNGDMWEIPQTYAQSTENTCDTDWFGASSNNTGQAWKSDMQSTFFDLYFGNRAPLSICIHAQNFGPVNTTANGGDAQVTPQIAERRQAFIELLDWLLSGEFPDVRIVSHAEALEWLKSPVALQGQAVTLSGAASPEPTPVAFAVPTAGPASAFGEQGQGAASSGRAAFDQQAVALGPRRAMARAVTA